MENGIELKGIISDNLILYPNKQYIITENVVVPKGITLTIKPGTTLKFGVGKSMTVAGNVYAIGTPDSLITFTKLDIATSWGSLNVLESSSSIFNADFAVFEYSKSSYSFYGNSIVKNCLFQNIIDGRVSFEDKAIVENTCFYNNKLDIIYSKKLFKYNNIINNTTSWYEGVYYLNTDYTRVFMKNNIFSNFKIENKQERDIAIANDNFEIYKLDSTYFGTTNENIINNNIYDFDEQGRGPWIDISNRMNRPSKEAHGFVWKVVVNGKDAQDEFEQLDPLGVGKQKFDVYFNREMDTKYPPTISMGVRYPYTQTTIGEDGTWSADSSIYTVYGTVGLTTGDGINTIRVSGAKDIEHFEIPIEDRRFKVIVNAAGSASTEFIATPGIGKVNLEWASNDLEDGLGYNMYRMEQINDSTLGVPKMINTVLITDTSYTDSNVIPNQKYFYYYKALRTNLTETDSSKMVAAIPLTASKGDANGDLSVNTMDITTIVAYILNNNPQPFIFEAADVNSDWLVNVLDIIKTVNKVLNGGQEEVVLPNEQVVGLYLQNDTLFADASVAIGGFQFDIFGVTSIDEIEKLNILDGFELGYSLTENTFRIILYSLTGKTIPVGNRIPLLKLKKGSGLTDIVLGDKNGSPINVTFNETGIWNLRDNLGNGVAELGQNFPNPFTGQTTIPVYINEPVDEATIHILNYMGQEIAVLLLKNPVLGKNLLQWNQGQQKGLMIYVLEIRRNGSQAISGVKKMLVD